MQNIETTTSDEDVGDVDAFAKFSFWTVALYVADREYGGPEEGGWWYDCGVRVDSRTMSGSYDASVPVVCRNEEEAWAKMRAMRDRYLLELNRGRRDVGSVLSEGVYEFRVHRGYPPKKYPVHRPHYE